MAFATSLLPDGFWNKRTDDDDVDDEHSIAHCAVLIKSPVNIRILRILTAKTIHSREGFGVLRESVAEIDRAAHGDPPRR
jgi:hypothetical protein